MKEPVDHILRPLLPWRTDAGLTECGLDASKAPTLTRQQFLQRFKDMGQRRTAILTCMTCSDTARRWGTWEDDPRKALEREIQWETAWRRSDHGTRLRDELLAVAALVEAHPDDDAYLGNAKATPDTTKADSGNVTIQNNLIRGDWLQPIRSKWKDKKVLITDNDTDTTATNGVDISLEGFDQNWNDVIRVPVSDAAFNCRSADPAECDEPPAPAISCPLM